MFHHTRSVPNISVVLKKQTKVSSHLAATKSLGWGVNRIRSFLQMGKLRPKHFLERGRIGDSFWPKQGLFSLCFAKERSLCSKDRRGQCSQGQFIPPVALRRGQTPQLLARRLVGHIRSVSRPSPRPSTPPPPCLSVTALPLLAGHTSEKVSWARPLARIFRC